MQHSVSGCPVWNSLAGSERLLCLLSPRRLPSIIFDSLYGFLDEGVEAPRLSSSCTQKTHHQGKFRLRRVQHLSRRCLKRENTRTAENCQRIEHAFQLSEKSPRPFVRRVLDQCAGVTGAHLSSCRKCLFSRQRWNEVFVLSGVLEPAWLFSVKVWRPRVQDMNNVFFQRISILTVDFNTCLVV